MMAFKRTITAFFEPKEDITAYELAQLVANLGGTAGAKPLKYGIEFTEDIWANLPENLKRHFRVKNPWRA